MCVWLAQATSNVYTSATQLSKSNHHKWRGIVARKVVNSRPIEVPRTSRVVLKAVHPFNMNAFLVTVGALFRREFLRACVQVCGFRSNDDNKKTSAIEPLMGFKRALPAREKDVCDLKLLGVELGRMRLLLGYKNILIL